MLDAESELPKAFCIPRYAERLFEAAASVPNCQQSYDDKGQNRNDSVAHLSGAPSATFMASSSLLIMGLAVSSYNFPVSLALFSA